MIADGGLHQEIGDIYIGPFNVGKERVISACQDFKRAHDELCPVKRKEAADDNPSQP